ncbi:MAG: phosphate acetyltransferase [Desulfomonile tiedjei]|uniref:Phosphate acetyltransferase n=1 Tax=Desulfomonile tiedjei TaxID=2358 RepID=A0A9D6Z540_9BACT|nr:phosphate acetyltransferase [Desulfomonile tiedjei]
MAQCIYVTGTEARSGKSIVTLGLIEWLSNQGRSVGFFRPVIMSENEPDRFIHLILSRYGSRFPYFAMYGCTYDQVLEQVSSNRQEAIFELILDKFRAMERQCEVIVSVGTDFTGSTVPLEFGFNADLAYNLNCPVVPIVKGYGKTTQQIAEAARVVVESLEQRRCDVLAVIVNRVSPGTERELGDEMRNAMTGRLPAFVIPEHAILAKPTVGEIARALKAVRLRGEPESLGRVVSQFKIAAMELPQFLERVAEGNLIITPGDRSDIIVGSLAADASGSYPRISGLLLTGGLRPVPQVQRLIQGLTGSSVPILAVDTDTFTTATNVNSVRSALDPEDSRKIAAALGLVEANVHFEELQQRLAVTRSHHVTPLMFEYELIQKARADRRHIVLPEGSDERILRAAEILLLRDVVDITLLGNPEEIRQKISALSMELDGIRIIDPLDSPLRDSYAQTYYDLRKHKGMSRQIAFDTVGDSSYFGTLMVYHEHADGMVSGAIHTTSQTIRPAFEIIKTLPGFPVVSSVFFMCLADRVLVFGDCAVIPDPNSEQLAAIAISSAVTAKMFGIEPIVAMLSYSTGESGTGEDVDKVRSATSILRKLRPDIKVEGPIQYDAAIDVGVARTKLPASELAGHATVFIFPDLNTGNTTYKAVQRSASAVAIGPVLQGLRKPVNDLSRGCTVADIVNTVAITAIQAQAIRGAV